MRTAKTRSNQQVSQQRSNKKFGEKIGFLGGGQLAQMLALKAHTMGLIPYVLCESSIEPAVQVAPFWMKGNPHDESDLAAFAAQIDTLTFESEFFSGRKLQQLKDKNRQLKIYPSPEALSLLQDRLFQKELLYEHKIPTAPYIKVNAMDDIELALSLFSQGLVLKKRMGGYDGNGTFVLKNRSDIQVFRNSFKKNENLFICEAFVPFRRELAISVVRNTFGEIIFLPLVETMQKDHRCDHVHGPVMHPRLNELKKLLQNFVEAIDYVGIIAFEIFDTGRELLINEIAPRVHNSAHYSQNALACDQFEYHIRAILGWTLPETQTLSKSFVMTNLIGTSPREPRFSTTLTGHMHWYQKIENRSGRKMGHINYTSASLSPQRLLQKALLERRKLKL